MKRIHRLHKYIPKDFSTVFIFDILSKILMIIVTVILIRLMEPNSYSVIVKFTAISSFLYGILGEGISLVFIRYSAEQNSRDNNSNKSLYYKTLMFVLLMFFLSIILIPALRFSYNTSKEILFFSIIHGMAISLNSVNQAYFQSKENYTYAGILNNSKNIILILGILLVILFTGNINPYSAFFAYIVSSFFVFLYGFILIILEKNNNDSTTKYNEFILVIKDSLWILLYLLILNLFNQMDIIMISNLMTDSDVAMYGIAFKYYSLLLTLLPSIKAVLRVRTSKKEYVDSNSLRKKLIIDWITKIWKYVILFCGILIISSDYILPLINGSQYNQSISAFKILVFGVGLSYIFAANISIMMSARRLKELCILAFIAFIFNATFNWIFIPSYGIDAAATITVISHAILNVGSTLFILKNRR